jgi:hypothetical protein
VTSQSIEILSFSDRYFWHEDYDNACLYRVTQTSFRAALFFTRTYNRLLRPGLAAVLLGHQAAPAPRTQSFAKLEAQITAYTGQLSLAP